MFSFTILPCQSKLASTIIQDDIFFICPGKIPRHFHFDAKIYKRQHYSSDDMSSQIIVIMRRHLRLRK